MDLTKYAALSFDCYGTLIDWEAGILGVLRPWATECGLAVDDEHLLLAYADHESAAEREQPSALYPAILAEAFRRTGGSLGVAVDETWAARLGDSVPDWPAFPDSSAALAALAERYRLIIVSNVHRAGFAASNLRLRGDFAAIITAEDVGAYKPADNHFVALDRTLASSGSSGAGCCTSRRACSTITCRRVVTGCHRSGSIAVTIDRGGARRLNRARSTRTGSSSPRWPSSPLRSRRAFSAGSSVVSIKPTIACDCPVLPLPVLIREHVRVDSVCLGDIDHFCGRGPDRERGCRGRRRP